MDMAQQNQIRQNYMDSPTYNPGGTNTYAIQNSNINTLTGAAQPQSDQTTSNPYGQVSTAAPTTTTPTTNSTPPSGTQVATDGGSFAPQPTTSTPPSSSTPTDTSTTNPYTAPATTTSSTSTLTDSMGNPRQAGALADPYSGELY